MRARAEYALVLAGQLLGAGAIALIATRTWQTVTTHRSRPFADDVLGLSGRTVDAAPTALALVALAGVVAVVATRGVARRAVGVLVAIAGAAAGWRSASALRAVGVARAQELVRDRHPHVVEGTGSAITVTTHPVWGVLSLVAGVLVLAAGAAVATRGARWAAMSQKYETPAVQGDSEAKARADASLWSALERGEDPTAHDPDESR